MIQIQKNDTLIDIIEKIQKSESQEIVLKFPIGHSILHNYLSLKIIKSKSSPKKITIITHDLISRKIGKNLGIKYSIIDEWSIWVNTWETNLMEHNFSFKEYLFFEIKKYYQEIKNLLKRNKQINNIKSYSKKYKSYSNIWFFIGLLCISLSLFIFIFYFAINKSTIIITPEISIKKKAKNFIFKENLNFDIIWWDKYIKIMPISKKIDISETYSATWIQESSISKSTGNIKIYNLFPNEIQLLPKTRVSTEDGIVFETATWISIPWSIVDNFWEIIPGEKNINVTAKNYDNEWLFIGAKGNIKKDTTLTLPWLNDNGKNVYAITTEDFSGWKDTYTLQISEQDITTSKLIFEQKLKNEVIASLKKHVQELNNADKTSFAILTVDNIIEYSNIEIILDENTKEWDLSKNVILRWSIIWKTYIYEKESLINKLRSVVQENILNGVESILFIDENSLRISSIIYRKNSPLEVKATVEIDTLISHDFKDNSNAYTEKLRSTIRWMKKQEAIKLLLNDPKISNVQINIRPFFLSNISNISENIVFKIKQN